MSLFLQIKPIGNWCNLKCAGCFYYYQDQVTQTRMAFDVLEAVLENASKHADYVRISWHGGEPLLIGIPYLEKAMDVQRRLGRTQWINSLQTNGLLIDKDWAAFLLRHNFAVGVSINGTEQLHDDVRRDNAGHGTYRRSLEAFRLLAATGRRPGVICTVTKSMVRRGGEILLELASNGVRYIAFNPVCDHEHPDLSITEEDLADFMLDVFDAWRDLPGNTAIRIREIYNVAHWQYGASPKSCSFSGTCSSWMAVEPDGSVYSCERIKQRITFGNAAYQCFSDIFSGVPYKTACSQIESVPNDCAQCHFISLCHNGCAGARIADGGRYSIAGKSVYCKMRLALHERITVLRQQT